MMFQVQVLIILTTFATINAAIVDYEEIEPFAQPEPTTVYEKAAVRFKPQLRIKDGCHPYPAVNEAGDISSGADINSGWGDWSCSGSDVGSQVYGRSAWCGGVWGMMYAWYFPMDDKTHQWENVVVWIDNPAIENPTILGVSASVDGGYFRYVSPDDWVRDGDSVQIQYKQDDLVATTRVFHHLDTSWRGGDFQDLIIWEQLTEEARNTLENGDFGESKVPLKNSTFTANLDFAIPGSIRKAN